MTISPGRVALSGPAFIFLVLLLLAEQALASGISIKPTRVELNADTRIVALTLSNAGDRDISFQVELAQWSQVDGEDHYRPTDDLLVTPPIFTLPAGEEQILRVGLRRPLARDGEQAYRLFVEELPSPTGEEINGLRMLLRLSLPVFVQTQAGTPEPSLAWRATTLDDGHVELTVHNSGTGHAQVSDLSIEYGHRHIEPGGMFYVLPGSTRRIPLDIAAPREPGPRVTARINGQDTSVRIGVD